MKTFLWIMICIAMTLAFGLFGFAASLALTFAIVILMAIKKTVLG